MATIFETYPNAPKFEEIKYFIQGETNVRITDEWQDKIVAACGNRWSQYDLYEAQFCEWLLETGKISLLKPFIEIGTTQQPAISATNVVDKADVIALFNKKRSKALADELPMQNAIETLINECDLAKIDTDYFVGSHPTIGKFKIRFQYFETHHYGGNRETDIDGDFYYSESGTTQVETLRIFNLQYNGESINDAPIVPNHRYAESTGEAGRARIQWVNWVIETINKNKKND